MKNLSLSTLLLCMLAPLVGQAREPLTDHALIAPYEGSTIRRKQVKEFDEYQAFKGMDASGKQATGLQLEGKITKILYKIPPERSILEIYRNYEDAVNRAGAEILYSCDQKKQECAKRYAAPTLQKYSDIHSISNLAGRYLLARVEQDEHTAYIAIAVGQISTDIHVIEVKKMDVGMVTLNATALGEGLDARGYVIVEGIFFDTDKATLQAQSASALEQISRLLKNRPGMKVFVVGHTDIQGSFVHNKNLSENRARAVVDELASGYDIARDRMEGHGVGPLAPQASNSNEMGKALNRRVVLVAR